MNLDPQCLRLYLVTDRRFNPRPLLEQVDLALAGGVTVVQLREKDLPIREFYDLGCELAAFLKPRGVPLIINDRLDLALAIDAEGLHVGQGDLPFGVARKLLGPRKFLGVSVGTPEEALEATKAGADYLGVSAIFDTATKADRTAIIGVKGLARIAETVDLPLVGISGIHKGNARSVIDAGASGVAVVSAILAAPDIRQAASDIRHEVDAGLLARKTR